jgi:hypothetical protein
MNSVKIFEAGFGHKAAGSKPFHIFRRTLASSIADPLTVLKVELSQKVLEGKGETVIRRMRRLGKEHGQSGAKKKARARIGSCLLKLPPLVPPPADVTST